MAANIGKTFPRHDFYDVAQIHNCHLMGKGFNQTQVMANKPNGDILLPLQSGDKFNDRFLNRNVQGAGSLVHNDELRLQGYCSGDGHALALTAGHVMRKPVRKITGQFYQFQQFPGFRIHFRRTDAVEVQQRFADNLLNLHLGIKGSRRILEYHLDMLTVIMQFLALHFGNIFPMEEDFAFRRAVKPYQKAHKSTLSTTGFTNQAQSLPFIELQIDIVTGGKQTPIISWETTGHMTRVNQQIFFIKHIAYLLTSVPHPATAWYTDFLTDGVYIHVRPDRRPRHVS